MGPTITDKEIIGHPILWASEADGTRVLAFYRADGKTYAISAADFPQMEKIFRIVSERSDAISYKYVENIFLDWARNRLKGTTSSKFRDQLVGAIQRDVRKRDVWVPIANFEIELSFAFGSAKVEPLTSATFAEFQNAGPPPNDEQQLQVEMLFDRLRKQFQGLAAAVVTVTAEPTRAEERARIIAQDIVGLLRFFSPAAANPAMLGPIDLAGSEFLPATTLFVVSDTSITITEGITTTSTIGHWLLSSANLRSLSKSGLTAASNLLDSSSLSNFGSAVRSALIAYGKGTTFPSPIDRLTHTILALETVLIKHRLEPVQPYIAQRLSKLFDLQTDRERVAQVSRRAFRISERSRLVELSPHELETLYEFSIYAYSALRTALRNAFTFETRAQFVNAVELHTAASADAK